ncbi:MAG: 30S ribosomal protein S6 [Armatimonadota bacterium]
MNTTIRNYETLYIVDANLADDQINPIIAKYSTLVTDQGGEVQAHAKWDKRRLAYEIKGRREGTYILMYFTGEPAVEKELDRVFRISDEIIRHIILRVEPERIDTSYVDRAQAAAEAAARAAEAAPAVEVEATEPVPEAPVEEAPAVEETPAEESPVEEAAAEETPAATEEPAVEEPKEE